MSTNSTNPRTSPAASRMYSVPGTALLVAVLLALAACAPDSNPVAAETPEPQAGDPVLDFYQCLRDNGLDVADPGQGQQQGQQVGTGLPGVDQNDPAQMAIVEECARTHLGSTDGRVTIGEGQMGDNLADTAALVAFVDCIRGHGFDMPDPAPDGRLSLPENADPQSPEFQNAARDCAPHLDGGGVLIGGAGGGGMAGRDR
jgi:hypothetical protein